jgi:hypothetical protein
MNRNTLQTCTVGVSFFMETFHHRAGEYSINRACREASASNNQPQCKKYATMIFVTCRTWPYVTSVHIPQPFTIGDKAEDEHDTL